MTAEAFSTVAERVRARVEAQGLRVIGFEIGSPAPASAVADLESTLALPADAWLRRTWTADCGELSFEWGAGGAALPEDLSRGWLELLSPDRAAALALELRSSLGEASGADEEGYEVAKEDWPYWTPAFRFPSADLICHDARTNQAVFCDHEVLDSGPGVHGVVLGPSLSEFVVTWARVGFVEACHWDELVDGHGLDINAPQLESVVRLLG